MGHQAQKSSKGKDIFSKVLGDFMSMGVKVFSAAGLSEFVEMVINTDRVLTKVQWKQHLCLLRRHMAKSLGAL